MIVLGIESSCDETAAAVYTPDGIRSNVIASQTIHEKFGGIVPELASRAHHTRITPTVKQALEEAGTDRDDVDLIAVTSGPGLMGSLLVGLCFAKGLSLACRVPLVGVNHIDAHIYSNFIDHEPRYPFVCLIVSGGHTRLVHVPRPFDHRVLGKTRDDAAGEAFDKIGKLLGLAYPAGPEIDRRSQNGDPDFHSFPRAMIREGFEFSFSGLKTSLLYYVEEKGEDFVQNHLDDICASVSQAITEVLSVKLRRAAEQTGVETVMLAGGVSANSMLRIKAKSAADVMGVELLIPRMEYCTDNAAMIAITGLMKMEEEAIGEEELGLGVRPFARMP